MKKHSFKVSQAFALAAASMPLLVACSGEMPQTGENYRSSEQALTGRSKSKDASRRQRARRFRA